MVALLETVNKQEARAAIRERLRAEFGEHPEVAIPDVARTVVAWLKGQPELLWEYQRESLYSAIYNEAQDFLAEMRSPGSDAFEQNVASFKERFSPFTRWMEHARDRHIRLLDMTREDLLVAAQEREARASIELARSRLWRAIADRLAPGEKVRDRFTVTEIEKLKQALEGREGQKEEEQVGDFR